MSSQLLSAQDIKHALNGETLTIQGKKLQGLRSKQKKSNSSIEVRILVLLYAYEKLGRDVILHFYPDDPTWKSRSVNRKLWVLKQQGYISYQGRGQPVELTDAGTVYLLAGWDFYTV